MNTSEGNNHQENLPEQQEKEKTKKVAALNDQLRVTGQGGQVLATQGISTLPQETQLAISQAIQTFTNFEPGNDPYGEHDFGAVEVVGIRAFWKIDYYDQSMVYHSPDKSNPAVTKRVMTIMLASEY